jgi:ribonuclease BN (tRNA processing enzyme)
MRKNETVLTPLYRLLLDTIEKNGLNKIMCSIDEIEQFQNHLCNDQESNPILRYTLQVLEHYLEDADKVFIFWNESLKKIKNESCNNCANICKGCKEYYWEELGEVLGICVNRGKQQGRYFPVRSIPKQIEKCLESSISISDLYMENIKRHRKLGDDFLLALKGMSSSTPSMLNSLYDTEEYSGGGFYFRYHGYGVAVDPGYHFVHNLHHYGVSVLDIDMVIITHEHIDHNNDMRLIDDLHYSIRNNRQDCSNHTITWIMDKVSYDVAKIYQKNETGFVPEINKLYYVDALNGLVCNETDKKKELDEYMHYGISLEFFQTRHIRKNSDNKFATHTFGVVLNLSSIHKCIVYTSDTAYFPELSEAICKCDILIANISGIVEEDVMLVKRKDNHLGYYGCYHLIDDCYRSGKNYPKILLVSEFWNGLNDIRYDVTAQLAKDFAKQGIDKIKVLPSDVGVFIDIDNLRVKCTQCGEMISDFVVQRPRGYNGAIQMVCKDCRY